MRVARDFTKINSPRFRATLLARVRVGPGQAVAHLTIQAQHEGLHTHQMGGFDGAAIAEASNLTEDQAVVTVTRSECSASRATSPPELREREIAPRIRLPLRELLLTND